MKKIIFVMCGMLLLMCGCASKETIPDSNINLQMSPSEDVMATDEHYENDILVFFSEPSIQLDKGDTVIGIGYHIFSG